MAVTKEILNSHPVATLKREIGKTNIRGYSKLGKADLITLMMKNKERFGHIQMAEKKKRVLKPPKKLQKSVAPEKPKRTKEQRDKRIKEIEENQKKRKAKKEEKEQKKEEKLPQKPTISQVEKATGLTREQVNNMNPLELFSLLPTVAKAKVSKDIGEDFLNNMEVLDKMKGFKKKAFKEQLESIQKDVFEKALGSRRFIRLKKFDYKRLVKSLRATSKLEPGQLSYIMNVFNTMAENEIKTLKPLQPKPRAKKPHDATALTNENLENYYYVDLLDDDYVSGVLENLTYNDYPGTRYDDPEEMSSRLLDRVYEAQGKRIRRLIRDYRKQAKPKPKTLTEAEEGLKKFAETHELDDYILKSDI